LSSELIPLASFSVHKNRHTDRSQQGVNNEFRNIPA
jgi:hypothetical protein